MIINGGRPIGNMKKSKEEIKLETEVMSSQWYNLRPVLGYGNIMRFFVLLGGREIGKSYSVANFVTDQFVKKGIPFTWIRLTKLQADKLLRNNAEKLIDADIRRKYGLDLRTRGNNVYAVRTRQKVRKDGTVINEVIDKKLFARVMDLSTFYSDKGAIFDKDFLQDLSNRYNVVIDEFERETGEKNTFDIAYALVNQLENILRSTKTRTKVFFLGNTLETASDVLVLMGFIPEKFGTFALVKNKKKLVEYLTKLDKAKSDHEKLEIDKEYQKYDFGKRCVIHYIQNPENYNARRKHSIANVLMPNASTFSNKIDTDTTLICKKKLERPSYVIKFTKNPKNWFTVWDGNIITKWNGEKKTVTAMRPYLDEPFSADMQKNIILLFDTRSFMFRNMITFKEFQNQLALLKPRNG